MSGSLVLRRAEASWKPRGPSNPSGGSSGETRNDSKQERPREQTRNTQCAEISGKSEPKSGLNSSGLRDTGKVYVGGMLTQGPGWFHGMREAMADSLCGWCPHGLWAPVFMSGGVFWLLGAGNTGN